MSSITLNILYREKPMVEALASKSMQGCFWIKVDTPDDRGIAVDIEILTIRNV